MNEPVISRIAISEDARTMNRELKIGDRIADNDPRFTPRVLTITDLTDRYVFAVTPRGHEVRIQRRRIYIDGKPRRTGFSLVPEAAA